MNAVSGVWTLTARWIFPVDGPPLERGTVTIDAERIVAVEPHGARPADVDLGAVAVLPGLVNAHTHLDLCGMRGLTPPSPDFTGWLRQVIAHRRGRTPEQVCADIHTGLAECVRFGTTLVGDISSNGTSWDVLAEAPLRAVIFRELLGLTEDRAHAALAAAEEWLRAHPATPTCRPGLSPHAPYSVRKDLIFGAAFLAARRQVPLAIHLAETPAELQLLRDRHGPFVAFLQELGVWDPDGLAESPAEVVRAAACSTPPLFVHGNYLPPDANIMRDGAVVYCPRTHAAFGHPPHPFRDFLAGNRRVAVGTDSLASNPDLDVLAEIRFMHQQYPDMPGAQLLRLATLSGAEALGWQGETGSLGAGKSADLVVVPLTSAAGADPHEGFLRGREPVRDVLFRGRWVHGPLSGS
jgi:cytosine/adenosine deaminase-related metal-dependent hydrolase